MEIICSLSPSERSTFSWCSYLNVKNWSHISLLLLSPCSLAAHVWGHSCVRRDAGFRKHDPGPLQTEDRAGSCLTPLRSTQRAVKAHHRHTLLRSIPYSFLTGCVSTTHSSFSEPLPEKAKERERERKQRAKICVVSDNVRISISLLFTSCL